LLCIIVTLVSQGAPAQEPEVGSDFFQYELDNGLQVVVVENHAAPLATVLVAIRGGAAVQEVGEEGLAHLFEHLLFRLYGKEPAAFATAASQINAYYNGSTSHELVDYYLMLPSSNTEKGIRLLGRLFTRADLRDIDLEEERAVVLDELERRQSDPEGELSRAMARELWGDAWHRRDVGGDSASLTAIDVDRLRASFERYYVPNNAALIVTGDVNPEQVRRWARRHFGRWERGADPFEGATFKALTPLAGTRATIVARNMQDVTIRIQLQGPAVMDDVAASYAAHVLFEILNNPQSHFQQQLVESGLFQAVRCSYATRQEVGPITIVGKTSLEEAHNALVALVAQIDSIAYLVGVSKRDLIIAKKRREVGAVLALEATATLAPTLASYWAGAGVDYYAGYYEHVNAQNLEDLRAFAATYLVNQPKVLGVLGPSTTMERIADWLRGNP
jgi:zinc protease